MTIEQQKKQMRQQMRSENALRSSTEKKQASAEICQQLIEKITVENSQVVAAFTPTVDEVNIQLLLEWLLATGRVVVLPRFTAHTSDMNFFVIKKNQQLTVGAFGILQPAPQNVRIDPTEIDIILVPGLAFDLLGNRLGRGKGYYDHYLKKLSATCTKIGVCFPWQIVESVPHEAHDEVLDIIIPFHSLFTT